MTATDATGMYWRHHAATGEYVELRVPVITTKDDADELMEFIALALRTVRRIAANNGKAEPEYHI